MRYFDTSILAPLILSEPASVQVERFVRRLPTGEMATSHWARVEMASLLARRVRMGALDARAARTAHEQFDSVLRETFATIDSTRADHDLACAFLLGGRTGLRGGDALHLAIAANRGAEYIYTLDQAMLAAGRSLGLPTAAGIRPSR